MPSQLTRSVFRRILANQGFLPRHLPNSWHYGATTKHRFHQGFLPDFRRSIFGFGRGGRKATREIDLDPGIDVMLQLTAAKDGAMERVPAAQDLVKAWRAFFASKLRTRTPLYSNFVRSARVTLAHLRIMKSEEMRLSSEDIRIAVASMQSLPTGDVTDHMVLVRELFDEYEQRNLSQIDPEDDFFLSPLHMAPYIVLLCRNGDFQQATQISADIWRHSQQVPARKLWNICLKGLAAHSDRATFERALSQMMENGVTLDAESHAVVVLYFIKADDAEMAKHWYLQELAEQEAPLDKTNSEMMHFILRRDELAWYDEALQKLVQRHSSKRVWDAVYLWAAVKGKSSAEIGQLMQLVEQEQGDQAFAPDAHTINGLLILAQSREDKAAAAEILSLASSRGIQPDAEIYLSLINHHLDLGDITQAEAAYENLQSENTIGEFESPTINRLIQELCKQESPNVEKVTLLVSDLEARNLRLKPQTMSALCSLFLERKEIREPLNYIYSHAYHFSPQERIALQNLYYNFCLDPSNSDEEVWDAYITFMEAFPEANLSQLEDIMEQFFYREWPERGLLVFRQIKDHPSPRIIPSSETYTKCFRGLSRSGTAEQVATIQNMLRLELFVDATVTLLNAQMLALIACDDEVGALEVWKGIQESREGPSVRSIQIAFRACENVQAGDAHARDIWAKMERFGIDATDDVFSAYAAALAGNACYQEVRELIECMQDKYGLRPSAQLLGTFHNASFGPDAKAEIKDWASTKYPKLWAELEDIGKEELESAVTDIVGPVFKINRDLEP